MPSAQPVPTIAQLQQAYRDGIIGQRERRADGRDGSGYDLLGGPASILWSRQGQRDRDLFNAVYFDTAEADDLTFRGNSLYGIPRILDTYGVGTASLARATAAAGAGTFPTGTRIIAIPQAGGVEPRIYSITSDVSIGATITSTPIPIRATTLGKGTAIGAQSSATWLYRIDDPIWDPTWTVQSLITAEGTTFEPAQDYRARVRSTRFANRVGYQLAIIAACASVGAVNVAIYAGNFAGDATDAGLNVCYVGDAGFSGSTALVQACMLALEGVRVAGADLQVLPLTRAPVPVSVTASLWDDPGRFNASDLTSAIQAAIGAYFDGRKNAFAYQVDAIAGAVIRASTAVQGVVVNAPTQSVNVTSIINGLPNFPATLTKWTVVPANIAVTLVGPQ